MGYPISGRTFAFVFLGCVLATMISDWGTSLAQILGHCP